MNVKLVVILAWMLLAQVGQYVQADEYSQVGLPVAKTFGINEHGGTDQNWSLTQAANGFIYVGTGTGITEWDGEQWQYYPTPNGTRVRAIAQWQDGGLYVGTFDDLGVYQADSHGQLFYHSLIEHWTAGQHQFGEIWSTVSNNKGVAFISNQNVYFWDGKQVHIITDALGGKHRLFALDDGFIYKAADQPFLTKISINTASEKIKFTIENTQLKLPIDAYLRQAFYNKQNELVLVTAKNGIYKQSSGQLAQIVSAEIIRDNVQISHAIQASDGFYYLTSLHHGLLIFNENFKLVRRYTQDHQLGENTGLSILEDLQNNIWLSGIPNVIKFIPPHKYSEYHVGDSSTIIDRLAVIKGQVIAAGDGLFHLTHVAQNKLPPVFEPFFKDKSINFDVTEYQGFMLYAGNRGVFARALNETEQPFVNIIDVRARSLKVDPLSGNIFVSSYEGLYQLSREKNQWQVKFIEGTKDQLEFLAIEDNGIIWVGTPTQELYRIENAQFTDREIKVDKFTATQGLASGNVMPFKLSSGVVLATTDGLMDYQSNRTPALQFVPGFPALFTTKGKDVFRLYEDAAGRIWYRIDQFTGYIKKDIQGQWQVHDSLFKPFSNSSYKDFLNVSNNILWFAQSSGNVYRANIALTETSPLPGKLHIRKVRNLENQDILYGGFSANAWLPELDQANNSIRIHYALSADSLLRATQYRYRLMGSGHDNWSDWTDEHVKDYTLLPGGDFQFQLEARDTWDRIYATQLSFSVKAKWYLTPLAWVIYGLLLLVLLTLSGWFTQRWRTAILIQRNVLLENTVAQRTDEIKSKVDELEMQQVLKERFFSNVSHEFRTPLTLTIAPLKSVLQEHPSLQKSVSGAINTALRNAHKMLDLVGHILDINRLDAGQFPLRVAQYDIAELLNQNVERVTGWASQQNQTLIVDNCADPIMLFFDRDQLDKCITNLLSNAIKYSGQGSQITVRAITQENNVGIEVIDNGVGIDSEFHAQVFERYYQGALGENVSQPGTGIGLALVKELIALHHGDITLTSQLGQGCSFILWLKRGSEHFNASQLTESIVLHDSSFSDYELPKKLPKDEGEYSAEEQDITTVLVVDDNIELRQFIALKLSGYYRIIQAQDGEEGLAKATALLPDLIISDVMMPKMDGVEMLRELRKRQLTNTIPLILLTAKSAKRDTVLGLQTGADDYISKPFDTSELIARVDGLIKSRKLIRTKLQSEFLISQNPLVNADDFANKMRIEVIAHITEPDFTIDHLAESLNMSRRSLSRKCQEKCQQSVNQFITEIRMQTALTLLNENKLSISEIAYGTGYESLSYFSRTFKKFYGKPPSALL